MAKKIYDLVVKTGSYRDQQGNDKPRYENIGAILQNDNGQFMMLKRSFNPAGVGEGESVLVSMFEPRSRQDNQRQDSQRQQADRDLDSDSIPF